MEGKLQLRTVGEKGLSAAAPLSNQPLNLTALARRRLTARRWADDEHAQLDQTVSAATRRGPSSLPWG